MKKFLGDLVKEEEAKIKQKQAEYKTATLSSKKAELKHDIERSENRAILLCLKMLTGPIEEDVEEE